MGNRHVGAAHNPGLYASCVMLVVTNLLLLSGHQVAFVGAALGWWLIIVHPTYLICTTRIWKLVSGAERVAYSLGSVILVLMVGGVLLDVLLPHIGVPRPLAQRPVLLAVDVLNVGLIAMANPARLHGYHNSYRSSGRSSRGNGELSRPAFSAFPS